ncbi:MAG: amidohydrolase family protein [Alcaligenaceae bacterium]|nr:MAG: amidohydrolase family protein [Alcaligenaceae bacterium]
MRIVNAIALDPATESRIENAVIDIGNGRIIWVGEEADAPAAPAGGEVVDARGRVVLPGLIDCHVHFASFADDPGQTQLGVTESTIAASTLRGAWSARRMLSSGVTSARDCGCKHLGIFALRDAIQTGMLRGPRILAAGAGITRTGGTGYRTSAEEVDGAEGVREAVRRRIRDGADVIKFFTSGGTLHPSAASGGVQYSEEEIRIGLTEASVIGRRTAVHAEARGAIALAVKHGATSIDHGTELDSEIACEMASRGTFLVPTLWHYQKVVVAGRDYGFDDEIVEIARDRRDAGTRAFQAAISAGVRVAAGTDSGGPRYRSGSLHMELRYMGVSGMSSMEVLRSATVNAADCLGIEAGRLAPGYLADLVSFEDDPARDLAALARPWLVVKDGVVEVRDSEGVDRRTEPAHDWLLEVEGSPVG